MSTDETHARCLTSSPVFNATHHTAWIGKNACEVVSGAKRIVVRGKTSKGIFLDVNQEWIIFLTSEKYRGPLTLNIDLTQEDFAGIKPGVTAINDNGEMAFDGLNLRLDYDNAQVWSVRELLNLKIDANVLAMRNLFIDKFAENLRIALGTSHELLETAITYRLNSSLPPTPWADAIESICRAILQKDPPASMDAVLYLAGRGHGLTPSGDDFMAGMLFAFSMAGNLIDPSDCIFRQAVLQAVRSRSTLISANLIACAADGEVNERIAIAVDYLLNGNGSEESALRSVLSWGASSGVDTIAGFLVALKLFEQRSSRAGS